MFNNIQDFIPHFERGVRSPDRVEDWIRTTVYFMSYISCYRM